MMKRSIAKMLQVVLVNSHKEAMINLLDHADYTTLKNHSKGVKCALNVCENPSLKIIDGTRFEFLVFLLVHQNGGLI